MESDAGHTPETWNPNMVGWEDEFPLQFGDS